jgi:uroporphyrinogen-III synthase
VDIITATSVQILHNLFNLLSERAWLKTTPFAVLSERIRVEAENLGVHALLAVAPVASDEGLFSAILQLRKQMTNT